ncbi:MAG: GNAT family N-acetyltransferase [Rhodobacteraceae bacterium]|nr:GNAT family N-acetyltransferase [Paracoccaceae bacterium]
MDDIARLRRFNRAVTREVGVLDGSFLGRGRPLGAARVLHLATEEGTELAEIRQRLDLDSGLMSRLIHALEAEGLIALATDPADRRRRVAHLTPAGAAERAAYDSLSHQKAAQTLARAGKRRAALVAAMDLIATVLNEDQATLGPTDPDDPAAQSCLAAYYALLCDTVEGLTSAHFTLPDPAAAEFRPPRGTFLLARSDDLAIGCVSLRLLSGDTAEVKRLWVHPDARGQGLARRLMHAVEAEARRLGYRSLKLDTNAALTAAIALYRAEGWVETAPYSAFPATHWFAKAL